MVRTYPSRPASLYGRNGQRKYLTSQERKRFIAAAKRCPRAEIGTLGLLLAYSGCRISEALDLKRTALNTEDGAVAIRSLKKRGEYIVREVPLPTSVMARLQGLPQTESGLLFKLSRGWAWHLLKELMDEAEIPKGLFATPKGLRHGFGVHAIRSGIPITLVQRWLGHSSLVTTSIYTQVLGHEEREIAARMWDTATE